MEAAQAALALQKQVGVRLARLAAQLARLVAFLEAATRLEGLHVHDDVRIVTHLRAL